MPRRDDLHTIMLIGSGPIVIGQGCEFDYSGTQACKALREEGYRIVLVNSNPATIMTDPEVADRTYIEPITPESVEKIIAKERPDALLPTLGGQTGLNTAVALWDNGVLEKYGVEMIGRDPRRHQPSRRPHRIQEHLPRNRPGRAPKRRRPQLGRLPRNRGRRQTPLCDPTGLHARRNGRRIRLQHARVRDHRQARPGIFARYRDSDRRIGAGLERI